MPMDWVCALNWVKSVKGCALFIFHLTGLVTHIVPKYTSKTINRTISFVMGKYPHGNERTNVDQQGTNTGKCFWQNR